MKNAILYNIITADVQTSTQSSTIKKKTPLSRCQKQKNKYEQTAIIHPHCPTPHCSRHRSRHPPTPPREKGQGNPRC